MLAFFYNNRHAFFLFPLKDPINFDFNVHCIFKCPLCKRNRTTDIPSQQSAVSFSSQKTLGEHEVGDQSLSGRLETTYWIQSERRGGGRGGGGGGGAAMAGSDSTVNTSRELLDAFNHKEVGYPVTETQRRAESPLSTRPLLFILSLFSLCAWC